MALPKMTIQKRKPAIAAQRIEIGMPSDGLQIRLFVVSASWPACITEAGWMPVLHL